MTTTYLQTPFGALKVEGVKIVSLGKFEGQERWVPTFWSLALDGEADLVSYVDDEPGLDFFVVTDEDKKCFPELEGADWVRLWESPSGFVTGERCEEPSDPDDEP